MLKIEIRLLTIFHLQTDRQIEQINQELEQYLSFFTEYRQRNQPGWLVIAEFIVNNKVYLATKILLFIANYGRKLRDRYQEKSKVKVIKFVGKIKKFRKKTRIVLRKVQKEIKRQVDRRQKEVEI